MMRLIWLMMVAIGVSGCTQAQRFALIKNAELDQCAMKRMAESKINGQHGYLQGKRPTQTHRTLYLILASSLFFSED